VELGEVPIVVGPKKAPVTEKPEATQAVLRKMAEAGSEAAKALLQEMEGTDAANSSKTKEQEKQENRFENHENPQEY
jgi:hypothetical protein